MGQATVADPVVPLSLTPVTVMLCPVCLAAVSVPPDPDMGALLGVEPEFSRAVVFPVAVSDAASATTQAKVNTIFVLCISGTSLGMDSKRRCYAFDNACVVTRRGRGTARSPGGKESFVNCANSRHETSGVSVGSDVDASPKEEVVSRSSTVLVFIRKSFSISRSPPERGLMTHYNTGMGTTPIASSPVVLPCKGVLFDMDGILISSLGSVERSWTKWANLRGVDPAYALRLIHGRRAIESAAIMRPDLDAAGELKLIEDIELADGEGITVLPGVKDLIGSLPKDRWTVVTSATKRLARTRLEAAGFVLPDRLVTAESVAEGKPNPAPYLAGAALLGFAPKECVVFEDSASGVAAGCAAGCIVVATTFSHEAEDLDCADYLVRDLTGMRVSAGPDGEGLILTFTPVSESGASHPA
jgi:sugar-phosphatase